MLFFERRRHAEGVLGDYPRPWTSCLCHGTVYLMPGSDQRGARESVLQDTRRVSAQRERRTRKQTLA